MISSSVFPMLLAAGLPGYATALIAIATFAIGGGLGYFVYRFFVNKKFSSAREEAQRIVEEGKLPETLGQVIAEKKGEPFKLTYQDQENLYVCAGYGEQPTGGYSIAVEEFYLTENAIYFDTTLIGPGKEEKLTETPSYPYIVILTEDLELPVVFQ